MQDIIKVKNLNYLHFQNINWSLQEGSIHSIIGPSGVGKSSFLRLFLEMLDYTGEILDKNNQKWCLENQNIAVQFQNAALLSHLSIGANIYLPLCMKYDISIEVAEYIAYGYMQKVGLDLKDFYKLPAECSGGMQKRVALARALITHPEILFLDEPTSGLDMKSAFLYDGLIKSIQANSKITILMVSHDLERVAAISDFVTLITKDGFFTDTFYNLKNHANVSVREFLREHG